MKNKLYSILLICFCFALNAQDTYHTNLQNELQTDYSLPVGSWVLNDTELDNLANDYTYGVMSSSDIAVTGQDFSQKVNLVIGSQGNNPWDVGYGILNLETVNAGDNCLFVIWVRSEGGAGKVSMFVENMATFEKEVFFTLDVGEQWTRYVLPFNASTTYAPGQLVSGYHLAWQAQTIETAGIAILNYENTVELDDLPTNVNNDQYGGWQPDADWRAAAADRIESIRKAQLSVRVENASGAPIPNANVEVEMLQHHYAFGSAVVSRMFAGNNGQNDTYESKLLDLDGEGHGFNWVVFENSMKWPGWEQNWISPKAQTAGATQWLVDHNIKVRGHTVCWPGWSNMPSDIESNGGNVDYFKNRLFAHIDEITSYPGIAGNVREWDVLNEITSNRDLEYALAGQSNYPTGREIYVEIFEHLATADPNTKTYLNDYVTIGQGNTGGGAYDLKKDFAQELIDAGVQLDGIGFQSHIGGFPTSIYDVYDILEDFHTSFGTTAKITEYDTNDAIGDELAATYLRDFLTITFSHPSTDGFLMWGFWDGAHWHDNAPMFDEDWTLKPAGQTFIDMVFDEWWTNGSGQTDANGEYDINGFKGTYQVTIDCGNGEVLVDTVELLQDQLFVKVDGELVADINERTDFEFTVFPNPAQDVLYVRKDIAKAGVLRIYDAKGALVYTAEMSGTELEVALDFGPGLFEVVLEVAGERVGRKVVVGK